jgi:hypothetical protein
MFPMVFFGKDEQLQTLGDRVLEATWQQFPIVAKNQIAMTWLVYDPPYYVNTGGALNPEAFWQQKLRGFSYRGVERIYPASVVKLFYLVAAHEWLERGMIQPSAELERAMRDMITEPRVAPNCHRVRLRLGNNNATLSIAIFSPCSGKNWQLSMPAKRLGVMGLMGGKNRSMARISKIATC